MIQTRFLPIAAAAAASLATVAYGQADPIARAKLEQLSEKLTKLKALSYRVKYHAEGGFGLEHWSDVAVQMVRPAEYPDRWIVKWDGKVKSPGEDLLELLLMNDPAKRTYTWVDHSKQEWGRHPEYAAPRKLTEQRTFAWLKDLADPKPLTDQIEAPEITPEPDAEIGGTPCLVILVRPEKGLPKRWWLGKDDLLPRKVEWVLDGGGMSGRYIFELSELAADPPLTPENVDIPAPDGYRRNEPPVPPPRAPSGDRGGDGAVGGEPATVITPPRVRSVGAGVGDLAPEFELIAADVSGSGAAEKIALSSLRGQVVVLDFWGTWSAKSKAAVPELKALAERYKGKPVKILGMTIRERDPAKPTDYAKQNGLPWAVLLAADDAAKLFKVRVYPTYVVIAPDGEIVHVAQDFEKEKTVSGIAEAIEKCLPKTPAAPPPEDGGGETGRG
ncbi:MAG: TlpA family protein disulfide reductase [Phycisphaerales bacterium]